MAFRRVLLRLAKDYEINCSITIPSYKCAVCPLGKAHKLSFAARNSRSIKPFKLVYVDLWTFLVLSVTSAKYVDDFSNYMWIYFISWAF